MEEKGKRKKKGRGRRKLRRCPCGRRIFGLEGDLCVTCRLQADKDWRKKRFG